MSSRIKENVELFNTAVKYNKQQRILKTESQKYFTHKKKVGYRNETRVLAFSPQHFTFQKQFPDSDSHPHKNSVQFIFLQPLQKLTSAIPNTEGATTTGS